LFTADLGGPGDNIIDSWHPKALRAVSTFDTTHQINTNYVIEMPFGKRRHYTMNTVTDAFLGGWDLSGVMRWTSGFPFGINNGADWATNWNSLDTHHSRVLNQKLVPSSTLVAIQPCSRFPELASTGTALQR